MNLFVTPFYNFKRSLAKQKYDSVKELLQSNFSNPLVTPERCQSVSVNHELIFLTAIWLPQDQLWPIIKGAASFTHFQRFRPEGHWDPR